jgi:hypothetical protein
MAKSETSNVLFRLLDYLENTPVEEMEQSDVDEWAAELGKVANAAELGKVANSLVVTDDKPKAKKPKR